MSVGWVGQNLRQFCFRIFKCVCYYKAIFFAISILIRMLDRRSISLPRKGAFALMILVISGFILAPLLCRLWIDRTLKLLRPATPAACRLLLPGDKTERAGAARHGMFPSNCSAPLAVTFGAIRSIHCWYGMLSFVKRRSRAIVFNIGLSSYHSPKMFWWFLKFCLWWFFVWIWKWLLFDRPVICEKITRTIISVI